MVPIIIFCLNQFQIQINKTIKIDNHLHDILGTIYVCRGTRKATVVEYKPSARKGKKKSKCVPDITNSRKDAV